MTDDDRKRAGLPPAAPSESTMPASTPVAHARDEETGAPLTPDQRTQPPTLPPEAPSALADEGAAATMLTPTAGVPFGRYQLLRKIATGGMAQLYLSTMRGAADFQKLCVVKKILPHLAEQPHFVNMFLDEARIAATLDHPNIVHIFDLGKVGSAYFIAMEYIAGEDLSHIQKRAVREGRDLPIELCCRIIADLCAGLHFAHEKRGLDNKPLNIVHRDVSPQNVLVTYSGQVKVVDFGIAKAANKVSHTRTGTIMGKSAYMSPEQCLGGELDRRSDVFAVGVLLFELLTGRRLFKRDNELLTMRAITEDPIPDPAEYRHNLPAELGVIVRRALQRERADRYATAQELREALERFIISFGIPATSLELTALLEDLFPDHIERQSRVREAGSISEVIAALPSTGTGVRDLGTPSANQVHTHTDTQPGPAKSAVVWGVVAVSALIAAVAVALLVVRPPPSGELVVASTPQGAEVRLDGAVLGSTPLALEDLKLDHAYQLQVSASGYTMHEENLILTAARPSQELRLVLEELPAPTVGVIVVKTEPPGAAVLLDGKQTGQLTPARLEGVAADLEHRVGLSLEGYVREHRSVLLRAGAEQEIAVVLAKVPVRPTPKPRPRPGPRPDVKPDPRPDEIPTPSGTGFLTLRTTPWTRVFHGKVALGETPLFKIELPAGKVRLRLVNEGKGIDEVITVTIAKDQETAVDKKL